LSIIAHTEHARAAPTASVTILLSSWVRTLKRSFVFFRNNLNRSLDRAKERMASEDMPSSPAPRSSNVSSHTRSSASPALPVATLEDNGVDIGFETVFLFDTSGSSLAHPVYRRYASSRVFFTDGSDDRCWFGFGEVKFADVCFRDPTLFVTWRCKHLAVV